MEMQMSAQVLYRTHLLQTPSHTGLLRIVLVIVLLYIGLRSLKGWCGDDANEISNLSWKTAFLVQTNGKQRYRMNAKCIPNKNVRLTRKHAEML
jgi:hypothetical protein